MGSARVLVTSDRECRLAIGGESAAEGAVERAAESAGEAPSKTRDRILGGDSMGVRYHFEPDDLAKVTFAEAPDPLWEALLSLHVLQSRGGSPLLRMWRREARPALDPSVRRLITLAPEYGYSPDFLTPAAAAQGLEPGLDAVLSTPRHRLGAEVTMSAAKRTAPSWFRPLADGDLGALRRLATDMRTYHDGVLAPYWSRVRAHFDAEVAMRARQMATGGVGRILATLHPALRWEPPVLEVLGLSADRDVRLGGRGLRLLPSFFCRQAPIMLRDETLPPVLVYPVEHQMAAPDIDGDARTRMTESLSALLGTTRAAVLEVIATGCTTTELARRVGISPAMASRHAGVLRAAGLVITRRFGSSVHHTLHPLGEDLLNHHRQATAAPTGRRPMGRQRTP
jgi:DNA-binding transcriptional ArsR family regulator